MPRGSCSPTDRGFQALAAVLLVLTCACATSAPSTLPSPQTPQVFSDPQEGGIVFLLYLPKGHARLPGPWPLILFLHGAGERGDDPDLVKREGLPKLIEHNRDFPFIVVSPQCRRGKDWSAAALDRLLSDVIPRYGADPGRVYATGLSSGAVASLELAALRPDRLAAVAAVAPSEEPPDLCRAAAVPVWLFHNVFDERVPARISRRIARKLESCGGSVQLTVYPEAGHDAWSDTYARADLYAWFLRHASARKSVAAAGLPAPRS